SRRRHTRWPRDWSSDVCSSDLRFALLERYQGCVDVSPSENLEKIVYYAEFACTAYKKVPEGFHGAYGEPVVWDNESQEPAVRKQRVSPLGEQGKGIQLIALVGVFFSEVSFFWCGETLVARKYIWR